MEIGKKYTIYLNRDTNELEAKDEFGKIQSAHPKIELEATPPMIFDGENWHWLQDKGEK